MLKKALDILQVGLSAACLGKRGFQESLMYAQERQQGGRSIIEYPDVKRMLLLQVGGLGGGEVTRPSVAHAIAASQLDWYDLQALCGASTGGDVDAGMDGADKMEHKRKGAGRP